MNIRTIGLLGFGEVGQMLGQDLGTAEPVRLLAWDVKFPVLGNDFPGGDYDAPVERVDSAHELAAQCDIILSAVTAAETLAAAQSIAPGLRPGTWFLDFNSASPGQKIAAAGVIDAADGRYVEGAVMSPVAIKRCAVPILLGGPHAAALEPVARVIGLAGVKVFSDQLGKASAAKMCRSVMVKGIEALLTESMLSARHYGVEEAVLKSLDDLFPGPDWGQLSRYMISRSIEHGGRRSEEMWEAARTVSEAGLPPLLSSATAERQFLSKDYALALEHAGLTGMLDYILSEFDLTGGDKT